MRSGRLLRMRRRESRYARTHAAHAQNQTTACTQGGACALRTRHPAHAQRRSRSNCPVSRMRRSAQNSAAQRAARSPPPPFCGACARLETREPRMRPSERRSTPRRSAQAQCPPPPPLPPHPGGDRGHGRRPLCGRSTEGGAGPRPSAPRSAFFPRSVPPGRWAALSQRARRFHGSERRPLYPTLLGSVRRVRCDAVKALYVRRGALYGECSDRRVGGRAGRSRK